MSLTVVPNEDGTINVKQTGGEEVTYNADDIDRCGLTENEKSFLRSMLKHAVSSPTTCRMSDYPPGAES